MKELGKEARLEPEKGRIKRAGKGSTIGAGEKKNKLSTERKDDRSRRKEELRARKGRTIGAGERKN